MKKIENALLGEKYFEVQHRSGLTVLVMPKPDSKSNYALIGTAFGSADASFCLDGRQITLPDGTAHFLEHKLFESEEKDAFELFAQTGASANAYTSFDRTCYLFSCSENFYENLRSLLQFVTDPYFTEQTVQKEQGIIGQEIKMYCDNPEWQASLGLLKNLYRNCAVNTDIAGSVESIAHITPQCLYDAYRAFYHPSNMILSVCGNADITEVLKICDEFFTSDDTAAGALLPVEEPAEPVCAKTVIKMPIAIPIFNFGYKEEHRAKKSVRERLETVLLNQVLIGTMSPLYQELLEEGLLGEDFSSEYFTGRVCSCTIFGGVSKDPELVKERFEKEVERVKKEGIDPELFTCVVKDMYGGIIKDTNAVEDIATDMFDSCLNGFGYFEAFEQFKQIKKEDLEKRLANKYDPKKASMCMVLPA